MVTVVTIIGLLFFIWSSLYNFVRDLVFADILNNSSLLTGLWKKTIDPFTGALRNSVLWITPFGILLLVADVVSISKPAKAILVVLFVVGLVLSATRSFFFGMLCALIVWAILTHNKKLVILLVIVAIVGFLLPSIGIVTKQFRRILYFPSDLERLTSFRYELFKIYWRVFMQKPLFGTGVGMTEIGHFPAGSPEYFIQQNLRFGGHGFFLGTLYTQGIIGLLPFLLLSGVAIKMGFALYRQTAVAHLKALGLFTIMFITYSLIPFLVGGAETYNQFFVVAGLVSGGYVYYKKTTETVR
jgi:O-antigen ligase